MRYCTSCGKQIKDNAAFCPYCGQPVDQGDELAKLVAAARTGDQDAVSQLYEKTYNQVYYTAKSMIRDEDAVFDIVQDTYIKAFAHLDSFQGDTKFLPWVRQIAANTARDWLKKKRPMLFTELGSGEEQDTPVEELFADERSENLPDQVIEQQETKRLLREIIEELPEDQRAAIGMFYYEEMSVKEIADAMEVSESAVKSRLMYGRNKIEKKVRELEKQGTKLYSLAPIPFLLLLFRSEKAYAAELPDNRILQAILEAQPAGRAASADTAQPAKTAETAGNAQPAGSAASTGAAQSAGAAQGVGTAGAAAAGTAAAGSLVALKVTFAALSVAAVVGVGTFGVVWHAAQSAEEQEAAADEDDIDREEEDEEEEAASDADREETELSEGTEEQEEPEIAEEPDPIEEALEQYRTIVGQAESYEFEIYYGREVAGYRYALAQMQKDVPVPALLLEMTQKSDYDSVALVRIFQYDPAAKTVHQPDETIAGSGLRCDLTMSADGNGLLLMGWASVSWDSSITRITMDGDSIKQEDQWEGNLMDSSDDGVESVEIEWHEIEDLSALDGWTAPDADGAAPSESEEDAVLPTDGDRIVLTGTVGTYDYDEIINLQGKPNPNWRDLSEEYNRNLVYPEIILDTPQTLRILNVDQEYSEREARMIRINSVDGMDQYEGQHITFSIDPEHTWWPSDSSLPLGQPYTEDIHVLE